MHAAKGPTADRLRAQFAKPPFDQVQPTGAGRDKVRHDARVALEPGPHVLVRMRPIIVHDDMQRDIARELLVEGAQELEEFLMPVPLIV